MSSTRLRKKLLARAKEMRRNRTPGERRLWRALRNRRFHDTKWRRQHVLSPYIVDFYCASERLAVEVDGDSHGGRSRFDERRDAVLMERYGVRVLRVLDSDVTLDCDGVLQAIGGMLE